MPIISKPFYLAKCDNCGEEWGGHELSAWSDTDGAERNALYDEWSNNGDVWHCPTCPPLNAGDGNG